MRKPAKKTTTATADGELDPGFARIAQAFEKDREVSLGKMFGSVGLKVNGKVFAMVVKNKLVVKLPKERADELVAARSGEYFDPGHGRLMREWVAVGRDRPPWAELAREAHRFVKRDKV